jgi:hypothetical protein
MELVPCVCISLRMVLEKFEQVPSFSHTKFFPHNKWGHLRQLQRQACQSVLKDPAICFIVRTVPVTYWSMFVTYVSLLSRLSASVTQSQSRVARKAGHNRSRHRATPAKVSVDSLWSLNGKLAESIACFAMQWWAKCGLQSNFINTKQKYMKFDGLLFYPHLCKKFIWKCVVLLTIQDTFHTKMYVNISFISHKVTIMLLCRSNPNKIAYVT